MDAKKKNKEFVEPKILNFVFSLKNDYIVSNITKTEIFRLVAEWDASETGCIEIWEKFLSTYEIAEIVVKEINFGELTKVCLIVKTKKKTLVNLMHMQVAKKDDDWFLTGEEKLTK